MQPPSRRPAVGAAEYAGRTVLLAHACQLVGDQIERVVLFGSRARGDAHADSDYDVAVFFKSLPDRWKARHRLADLRVEFLDATGDFFDTKPFATTAYEERTPLMREIRREGVDL